MITADIDKTSVIPAGTYSMGGGALYSEEFPSGTVTLQKFNIDKTEVTNAQFAEFVEATGYVTRAEKGLPERKFDGLPPRLRKPGSAVFSPPALGENAQPLQWWRFVEGASWRSPLGPGSSIDGLDHHPVVHIALEDAIAYANWRGRRLPTEKEWEAAAIGKQSKADETNQESDAPIPLSVEGNTWQGVFPLINQKSDGFERTAPVGCFAANGFGLFDMIGNVWEHTISEYSAPRNHESLPAFLLDNSDIPANFRSVIKGGSYLCADNYCKRARPAARQPQEWALSASHIGFRTVGDSSSSVNGSIKSKS